jgi:hypothetical protein
MVKTFIALDNEFAAATGSNVNNAPNTSTFDYPPNSTKDLTITSKPGDSNPNLFELGETYDVAWGGNGGGKSITDAVVIRSDDGPNGEGGIIVFEGTDENGEMAQIVWSPGVDLEGWYWDNFDSGSSPGFWTADQNSAYVHNVVCFGAPTRIRTEKGDIPAGQITPGMRVWTLDAGYQPVIWVGHRKGPGLGSAAPVVFEQGSIDNSKPMVLSQQHRVLIKSPMAELYFASPEVFVPAKAMIGSPGISLRNSSQIEYAHLLLDQHHILKAEGALCESLFMGDVSDTLLSDEISANESLFDNMHAQVAARPMLTYHEARKIVGSQTRLRASLAL